MQGMPWGWGLSCSGDGGARAAFWGKKQRDTDVCIGNGAGHEVTPMFQRRKGVNQGMCGVHRGRKLAGLSQPVVGPTCIGD